MSEEPVATAAAALAAVRRGEEPSDYFDALATLEVDALARALDTDAARVAFWLNVYNAAAQRTLAETPERYASRRRFFRTSLVTVAGRELSLDDVEHRVLRRGYPKWTLGYLRWPFVGTYARRLAPSTRDPRIHFALNCGAASCPLIRAYSREDVDAELDAAARTYLAESVEYDPAAGRVRVPRVFLWFRGDFGGKDGILAMLRRYDQLPADVRPRLRHRGWDWSLERGAYAGE